MAGRSAPSLQHHHSKQTSDEHPALMWLLGLQPQKEESLEPRLHCSSCQKLQQCHSSQATGCSAWRREYFAAPQQTRLCWRIIKSSSLRSAGIWAVKIIIIRDGEWVIGLLLDHLRHLSEDISPAIRRSWGGGKGRQQEQCCSREGFVSAHKAFFSAGLLGFAQVSSQIN